VAVVKTPTVISNNPVYIVYIYIYIYIYIVMQHCRQERILNSVCASRYTLRMWRHIYIFQNGLSSQHTYSVKMRYYNYYVSSINCKVHHVTIITYRLNEHHHKSNNFQSIFQRLSLHSHRTIRHSEGICLTSLLHATEGESLNKDIT